MLVLYPHPVLLSPATFFDEQPRRNPWCAVVGIHQVSLLLLVTAY